MKAKTYSRDGDDSVSDLLSEVSLGGLLHLDQNHGGDFFGGEDLLLTRASVNLDVRLGVPVDDFEGEILEVMLNRSFRPFATDQSLSVENLKSKDDVCI